MPIRKTKEQFIKEANLAHKYKYDYSEFIYINGNTKGIIICPIDNHGKFSQTPGNHLGGPYGCPECGGTKRKTLDKFIKEAKIIWGEKYDYSKCGEYIDNRTELLITCLNCQIDFMQSPFCHLLGCEGCSQCLSSKRSISGKPKNIEKFIEQASLKHKNKYTYTKFVYINNKTKSIIICPKHGEFIQEANNHLNGEGCPKCPHKNQTFTDIFLKELINNKYKLIFNRFHIKNVDLTLNGEIFKKTVTPDFVIRLNNKIVAIIEYNGEQHYKPIPLYQRKDSNKFLKQQIRDQFLRDWCRDKNIPLIEIDGRQYQRDKIKDFLEIELKKLGII